MDSDTGLSRGFGFIYLDEQAVFDRIMKEDHFLDGRRLDCNIACKRSEAPTSIREKEYKRVFVGGISTGTDAGTPKFDNDL